MAFRPKVLVVEDDATMLHLLGEVLGQMGAEPRLVSSSLHAAELAEQEKFDGIFLDLIMPGMDGLELAQRIRGSKSNSSVPLVMITASHDPGILQRSFQAGINFFLQKPVTVPKLQKLLNAARGLMLEERRRYQRAPVALLMRCRWVVADGGEAKTHQVTGQSVNVSASGALVELSELPPVSAAVRLEFSLPGNRPGLALAGRVVRHHSIQSAGIHFEELDDAARRRLMEFVERTLGSLSATA